MIIEPHVNVECDFIRRLKARDPQALADLYDRHGRMLYGRILRIVGDRGTAEDLTQETMLRIWNGIGGFDDTRACLATWMGTVARNQSIDYLRSRAAKATVSVAVDRVADDGARDFEEALDLRDRLIGLRKSLRTLKPHQQLVLNLSYVEGMSHAEISKCLNRPLGTVKTWIRGALQVLRVQMGQAAWPVVSGYPPAPY